MVDSFVNWFTWASNSFVLVSNYDLKFLFEDNSSWLLDSKSLIIMSIYSKFY